jgi:ABC-type transport system involved in multi-copper enzyme maturation permease subunit
VNPTTLLALFEDARQQVLDNKVFRLLIILTAIPILATFVIGFREEHISFLWGYQVIEYDELLRAFGGAPRSNSAEIHVTLIQAVQEIFVTFFAGSLGMILCISATAFFTPRILEKGAADTLFSKPVSRGTILLSRYFAGLLFVAFISAVLVLGMYLGFLLVSGYNDPGFLWGALTLVYLYGMMHSFSMAIAVFTRSSTAAILLTLFLFIFSGAIHGGWQTYEYFQQQELVAMLRAGEGEGEDEQAEEEQESRVLATLVSALKSAHFVLPKTSDADLITRKLRRAIMERPPVIETEDRNFLLKQGPPDFELVAETGEDLEGAGVLWRSVAAGDVEDGRVRISRKVRPEVERTVRSRKRIRPQTARDAADALEEELGESAEGFSTDYERLSGVQAIRATWTDREEGWSHDRFLFTFDDWIYEVDIALAPGRLEGREARTWRRQLLGEGNLILGRIAGMRPDEWYETVFTWDAELKYNIFFSIGSSLAFILAMLGLAWARLRTVDF